MNFGLAYNATIEKFSLKVTKLSKDAEVHRSVTNRLCNGSQSINTESMEKLLLALDDEAFLYWVSQIVNARTLKQQSTDPATLIEIVRHLNNQETASLLRALAAKLRHGSREDVSLSL